MFSSYFLCFWHLMHLHSILFWFLIKIFSFHALLSLSRLMQESQLTDWSCFQLWFVNFKTQIWLFGQFVRCAAANGNELRWIGEILQQWSRCSRRNCNKMFYNLQPTLITVSDVFCLERRYQRRVRVERVRMRRMETCNISLDTQQSF